jgi:hypothetical protein
VVGAALLAALFAAAAFSAANVTFRASEVSGQQAGEVLIGDMVVIRLLTADGQYYPEDRAEIVAGRLQAALAAEPSADRVTVTAIDSARAIYIADQLIVTVSEAEATAHGTTPVALAGMWRENILTAANLQPPAAEGQTAPPSPSEVVPAGATATSQAASGEVDWSGAAQKWVPIFSLESGGAYVGAAQIAGPTAQVAKVKGVAELRLNFENIGRIYAYIPTSSINVAKLDRVQGVSVWATGDLRIIEF